MVDGELWVELNMSGLRLAGLTLLLSEPLVLVHRHDSLLCLDGLLSVVLAHVNVRHRRDDWVAG